MPPSFYGMPEETIAGNAFASHARAAAVASGRGPGSSFTQAIVLLGADFTVRLIWAVFGLVFGLGNLSVPGLTVTRAHVACQICRNPEQ